MVSFDEASHLRDSARVVFQIQATEQLVWFSAEGSMWVAGAGYRVPSSHPERE